MPCMGPFFPDEKEIDDVTEEVMKLLRENHGIYKHDFKSFLDPTKENRKKQKEQLREAIKQLLWDRNCEEF